MHVIDQMRVQGKPGLFHCFTPERDNKSIKDINLNSKDVFYHLLKISGNYAFIARSFELTQL